LFLLLTAPANLLKKGGPGTPHSHFQPATVQLRAACSAADRFKNYITRRVDSRVAETGGLVTPHSYFQPAAVRIKAEIQSEFHHAKSERYNCLVLLLRGLDSMMGETLHPVTTPHPQVHPQRKPDHYGQNCCKTDCPGPLVKLVTGSKKIHSKKSS